MYQSETSKAGLAPINAFVLVEWGSILLQHAAQKGIEAFRVYGLQVVQAHSRALELILSSTLHVKKSVQQSAVTVTRRALRRVLRALGVASLSLIVENLTIKGQSLGIKAASFLGVLAGVCSRLPEDIAPLAKHKEEYYSFYLREILSARSLVPEHLASAMNDFFAVFTTFEDLKTVLVPSLEKALLRAPEVVLNDLVSPLFSSISKSIDVGPILANNLSKPLLSNIKSSNASIRDGSTSAFSILAGRSRNQEALGRVIDDVLLPMLTPKLTADQRAFHAKILAKIPTVPTKAKGTSELLCTVLSKESNEAAVGSEISALLSQFRQLSNDNTLVAKAVAALCAKGIEDKRPGFGRQWMLGVGSALWEYRNGRSHTLENPQLGSLEADCLHSFLKITEEVIQNPITAASSGLAVAPMITLSLGQSLLSSGAAESTRATVRKAKLMEKILSTDGRTATLLNPRIYTRLAGPDLQWQIRALQASSTELGEGVESEVASAWSQAIIHLIATDGYPKVREMAMFSLSQAYLENRTTIAKLMINGLWTWYQKAEAGEKEAATGSRAGMRNIHFVIRSICLLVNESEHFREESSKAIMQAQLIEMLVLCRPEIIPHVHWIELCLRVGEDPGLIARSNAKTCLERVKQHLSYQGGSAAERNIRLAAYNTAAELAFVSPEPIIPLLLEMINDDLPVSEVSDCGPTETAIAQTPEGISYTDVLMSGNQKYPIDKNSKDYDTLKWEEEMRNQIAKKKGQERKLTADEKAKVSAQLIKEASIRQKVRKLERRLRNSIGYIHALATGPPTDAIMWLNPCLQGLTSVIGAGADRLVGDAAGEVYLICSDFVSSRLGPLRRFIGIATLRMLDSHPSPALEQEPLRGP